MQYKVVLFDLDGTSFNTSKGIIKFFKIVSKRLGLADPTDGDWSKFIGPTLHDIFRDEFGLTDDEVENAIKMFVSLHHEQTNPEYTNYDGFAELVQRLYESGIVLGVATLKSEPFSHLFYEHAGLDKYFKVISGSAEGKITKTEVINDCLKKLNITDPASVVLIGDSDFDGIGAREAGCDFIAVTYGFGFKNKEDAKPFSPVFIADNLPQVEKFLFDEL